MNFKFLRLRHKRLETNRKKRAQNIHLFWKYQPLYQVNVLSDLLCLVTYVTTIDKCSYIAVKPSFFYTLLYEQDNPKYLRYPAAVNIFIYFYLNNTYQMELLKTWDRAV